MSDQEQVYFKSAKEVAKFVQETYSRLDRPLAFQPNFKNPIGQHMRLWDPENQKKFHVKFAQERFHKFSLLYPNFGKGEGESIRKEVVDSLGDDDIIFFGNPGEILKIFVGDLKENGVLRNNDAFKDQTYSVGVEFCEKFF